MYDEVIILSRNCAQVQGLQDDTDNDAENENEQGSEEQRTKESDKGNMVCCCLCTILRLWNDVAHATVPEIIRNDLFSLSLRCVYTAGQPGWAGPSSVSNVRDRGNPPPRMKMSRLRAQSQGSRRLLLHLNCDDATAFRHGLLLQCQLRVLQERKLPRPKSHVRMHQRLWQLKAWRHHLHNGRCRRGKAPGKSISQSKRSRKHASFARVGAPAYRRCCRRRQLLRLMNQYRIRKMCRFS